MPPSRTKKKVYRKAIENMLETINPEYRGFYFSIYNIESDTEIMKHRLSKLLFDQEELDLFKHQLMSLTGKYNLTYKNTIPGELYEMYFYWKY